MAALTWGQLGQKLYSSAKKSRAPISGQFELTARCNLHCKMCYVCKNINDREAIEKEHTAEEWIDIARQARDHGMLYLLLTGGEVFLREDFMFIYSELVKMGFHIEIYTNATMITPEIAKKLGRIPPSKVGVTIYGASPETYEKICGNRNGYEMAMRGVELLLSEGITVWLKTTVVKGNVDDFEQIANYAYSKGLEFGTVSYISPRREGCGTCPEAERLSPSQLISFRRYADSFLKNKSIQASKDNSDTGLKEKEIEVLENEEFYDNDKAFNCVAGKCAFWITWDGHMTPCALMDDPYSLPFNDGFIDAWEKVQESCDLVPVCNECKNCSNNEICMPCPARLKLETGYYDKPAPYLCGLVKEINSVKEVMKNETIC